jgi:hypothetical protein
LVRSIVLPVIERGEEFLRQQEALPGSTSRRCWRGTSTCTYRHRRDLRLLVQELTTLSDLGVIELVIAWRRIAVLLLGPEQTLEQSVKATVALGGLQNTTIEYPRCSRMSCAKRA